LLSPLTVSHLGGGILAKQTSSASVHSDMLFKSESRSLRSNAGLVSRPDRAGHTPPDFAFWLPGPKSLQVIRPPYRAVVQRLITEHYANWAMRDNTQVPSDSFNEYMPIKKVAMQATDDRKQRA
jgi:hypothetical protein